MFFFSGLAIYQVDVAGIVISAVNIVWPITHRTLRVHISRQGEHLFCNHFMSEEKPAVKIQKAIWTNARHVTLSTLVEAGAIRSTLPELAAI